MRLSGKKIALGVTGSIAAYKAAALCRILVAEGASVRVVMTPSATDFITPLTLSVCSGNEVWTGFTNAQQVWNNHVELGLWADLILVAPASAHTISSFAHGQCTRLLDAVYLSARCSVMIAPAMDHDMFLHPATQKNMEILAATGVIVLPPAEGALASGLTGKGRMQEPDYILEEVVRFFEKANWFKNRHVLITAGPTREAIDPVRFISNHSSGKMGLAIAEQFRDAGAHVTLVAGPVQIPIPTGIAHVAVETAAQMYEACIDLYPQSDITVMCAAVADYAPDFAASTKIKKTESNLSLNLIKTKDILAELGRQKRSGQFLAGFALETDDEMAHALKKMQAKNLDMIVLNSLREEGAGFGHDSNKVSLLFPDHKSVELPLLSKREVASEIVRTIAAKTNVI